MEDNLTTYERALVNEYISFYGESGYQKLLDCFGRGHTDIGRMYGRKRENALKRIKSKVDTIRLMKVTGDYNRMENNYRMVMNKDDELERVWYTADGREKPLSKMSDRHLHNTILFISRKISEGYTEIGGNEDLADMLDKMEGERIKRGLHLPLIPLKSLEYRKGEIS